MVGALSQMNASLMTPDGVSRLWKWDPDAARKLLVRMVVSMSFLCPLLSMKAFDNLSLV
jgi:hypothetical protein